jgi:hypothetical protein
MFLETVLSETSQAQEYLRPLGSFEELLWQMNKRSPLHATLAAQVDGTTTIEEWRAALEQTRRRHPLWSGRDRSNGRWRDLLSVNARSKNCAASYKGCDPCVLIGERAAEMLRETHSSNA